jgi:prepilin-type processing-associated H-X9-DG protein
MNSTFKIKAVENHDGSQVSYLYADGHINLEEFMREVKVFRMLMPPEKISPAISNPDLEKGCHAWININKAGEKLLYEFANEPNPGWRQVTVTYASPGPYLE